jgi:hypothetical protein
MKFHANWLIAPAFALGLGACSKADDEKSVEPEVPAVVEEAAAPAPAASTATATAPPPVAATAVTAEERAAKLGFVRHLPQDTEVVMSLHNGSDIAERFQSSKLWKLIESEMGMGMGGMEMDMEEMDEMDEDDFELPDAEQDTDGDASGDADEEPAAPLGGDDDGEIEIQIDEMDMEDFEEPVGPAALFGTEFTMAFGKSVGEQSANLLKVYSRISYFQMRALARSFAASAKSGDFSEMEDTMDNQFGPELFKDLISDPESGVAMYEKLNMPPIYLAFRTKEADREAAAQQIAATVENVGMFEDMVEAVEVEKAGASFTGYKIPGSKIAESMGEDREDMDEMLGAEIVDKIIAATATKDMVILSGTLGEYVILFIGGSVDDLRFADTLDDSMASGTTMAFCDSLLSKDLAAVIYGQKDAITRMFNAAGGVADMAGGLRDGLAGAEGLGDTRDIEALLRLAGEREAAVRNLASTESVGMAAFFEDGLKIESFGGTDNGAVDWKSPNRLAPLGESADVMLFANMTSDATYNEKMREYLEVLVETTYAMGMKVAEFEIEDEGMAQFQEMAKMFDEKFRSDLVAMWDTFNEDFGGGLGTESALIVDLGGSVPAIPGIPQAIVDEGKFPRITLLAPVTDRAKLATSWEKMHSGATGILAKISEMAGEEIPMQKPMSSDKDNFKTWFFSMPFLNDDFIPSVTLNDEWFAASTSKDRAVELMTAAAKGGDTHDGLVFSMNFKALQTFVTETLDMIEKNPDAVPLGSEELANARKVVTALEDVEKLTVHMRRDDGVLRSTVHFKIAAGE